MPRAPAYLLASGYYQPPPNYPPPHRPGYYPPPQQPAYYPPPQQPAYYPQQPQPPARYPPQQEPAYQPGPQPYHPAPEPAPRPPRQPLSAQRMRGIVLALVGVILLVVGAAVATMAPAKEEVQAKTMRSLEDDYDSGTHTFKSYKPGDTVVIRGNITYKYRIDNNQGRYQYEIDYLPSYSYIYSNQSLGNVTNAVTIEAKVLWWHTYTDTQYLGEAVLYSPPAAKSSSTNLIGGVAILLVGLVLLLVGLLMFVKGGPRPAGAGELPPQSYPPPPQQYPPSPSAGPGPSPPMTSKYGLALPNGGIIPVSDSIALERNQFRGLVEPSRLTQISRNQCQVIVGPKGPLLLDGLPGQPSTNGTFLNGQAVRNDQPTPLNNGDRISLAGAIELEFRVSQ